MLRFLYLTLLICALSLSSTSAQMLLPNTHKTEDISIISNGSKIFGTLTLPAITTKMPVVLIIAGSGPTDRDGNNPAMKNNSLKLIAELLANFNIASVRFDKRGIAASKAALKNEADIRFENYVEDAVVWAQVLKSDKRFSQVAILGHSEGSLIGMLAAKRANADLYISVSGPGRSADEIILDQLSASSTQMRDMASPIIESLKNGQTVKDTPASLQSIFRPSVQPYLISWFKYDPSVEIAKLVVPVLILQGSTDIQVSKDEAERLKKALPGAELSIIDGMNHVLKTASANRNENLRTYNQPHLPLHPSFCTGLIKFMKEHRN